MEPPPSVHGPHKEAPGSAKSPAGALEPTQPRPGDPSQAHVAAAGTSHNHKSKSQTMVHDWTARCTNTGNRGQH